MRSNSTKHADPPDKSEADKQALTNDIVQDLFRRETSFVVVLVQVLDKKKEQDPFLGECSWSKCPIDEECG